jgi:F-type H+-transporting ATPase subunit b
MDYQEVAMDPVLAIAASKGGDHPLIDIDYTVLLQFGLFVVMFFVARALLFTPYLKLRELRQMGIDGARAEAERMSSEADAKLADYERQLTVARTRAGEEQRKIRSEAAAHERQVTEAARSSSMAALEHAQGHVRSQTASARAQLMPQATALAKQMASKLLGREVV